MCFRQFLQRAINMRGSGVSCASCYIIYSPQIEKRHHESLKSLEIVDCMVTVFFCQNQVEANDTNKFCIYNISVRRTVSELQPFVRSVIRTPTSRLQNHPRSKLMAPLEKVPMSFYLKVAKWMTGRTIWFPRYRRFYRAGTISGWPSWSLEVGSS